MVGNRLSKTAVLAAGIAISTCAATFADAQTVAPTPVPVAASSSWSIAVPVIAVGAAAVSVIGYAAYISATQHRELTHREAMTAIFLPFIGPALHAAKSGQAGGEWQSVGTHEAEGAAWTGLGDALPPPDAPAHGG
jgi:hypothetical protein